MRRIGIAGLVLTLGFALASQTQGGVEAEAGADSWRRTAHGWERIENWRLKTRSPDDLFVKDELVREVAIRWDVHPATLVAGQALAIALAFFALPRPAGESRARINGRDEAIPACDAAAHAA